MSGLKFANRGLPDHTQINAALAEVKRLTAEVKRLTAELVKCSCWLPDQLGNVSMKPDPRCPRHGKQSARTVGMP